jgi:hypothetical protein
LCTVMMRRPAIRRIRGLPRGGRGSSHIGRWTGHDQLYASRFRRAQGFDRRRCAPAHGVVPDFRVIDNTFNRAEKTCREDGSTGPADRLLRGRSHPL